MSQAQEARRAATWESQHKKTFEAYVEAHQALKKQIEATEASSPEYAALKERYEAEYAAAEEFFMKYYES